MKIGVVCEGATDFVVISFFLSSALEKRGVSADVFSIQPPADNTKGGGCTEVVHWLINNPPPFRTEVFFGGGIFDGDVSEFQCDILVVQMDSDVLSDESFKSFMEGHGLSVFVQDSPEDKAGEVERILYELSCCEDLSEFERRQHVMVAAVDAIEAWCIAAFQRLGYNPEELEGQQLVDEFGKMMARFNRQEPNHSYAEICKSVKRRKAFCKVHSDSRFVEAQSEQFYKLVERVLEHS